MSENEIPSGWQTSSGLAVDDADVTVEDVVFRYDSNYNNGETLVAAFRFRGEDGEEIEQFFPCGKGWEPAEKGQAARHESGKTDKRFNKNSAYGSFADSAIVAGAGSVLFERGNATEAKVWKGLKFHVEAHTETFTIDGDKREVTRIIATSFLGVEGEVVKGAKAPSASKPAASAPAASNGNGGGELSAVVKAKLKALAAKHDSHDAFMEEAFAVDGVMGDSAAEQVVMDPSDAGFYALARA